MYKIKTIVSIVLTIALLFSFTACSKTQRETADTKNGKTDFKKEENVSEKDTVLDVPYYSVGVDTADSRDEDYNYNKEKTFAVGIVTYQNDPTGWGTVGSCAEGFDRNGQKTQIFKCEIYNYYNYSRLKKTAEADAGAVYHYFDIGPFGWSGGGEVSERRKDNPDIFDGDITQEFIDALHEHNKSIQYTFYIDWNYQDKAEYGDVVLMAVDPQLSINPNYFTEIFRDRIKYPKKYSAVVAPFSMDSPKPHIVHFVDGKLELPVEFNDAFELRRLYNDTDPELTSIKDGDSIETVVKFLRAVEQDMIRYEREMRQQPVTTDVSLITPWDYRF